MIRSSILPLVFALLLPAAPGAANLAAAEQPQAVIALQPDATPQEHLAAKEIRRYAWLRTGTWLAIEPGSAVPDTGDWIVVANKDRPIVRRLTQDAQTAAEIAALQSQQYVLRTLPQGGRQVLLVVGGDKIGTLYGAYRLAEHLGVRFFLHGDVVPDQPIPWELPKLDEIGKPLFELRGLNPWGSHPFGFDLWNADDYKAQIGQMAKMRMNFIGMHCYPEGHPYAEPTVWVGLEKDFDQNGQVTFSYPASYYNALFKTRWGGLHPGPTGQYRVGAAMLFDRDGWGPEVMRGHAPRPEAPQACNEVFNRTAAMFREAFTFARSVGVKTCLGTESPLIMPKLLQERLSAEGKTPADPAVVREVYRGIFRRIAAAHPLDYYWLWTPEGWTWSGNTDRQMKATMDDIAIALEALKASGAPFRLATCGWVLGPNDDRAGFDRRLPEEIALSAISRHLGEDPIDPAFARVERHDKWAIPWMEGDNGGLAVPQLWVGRTRQDAVDARAYGCSGLMGLIWRTRILGPNIATLAQAGWEQPWSHLADQPAAPPAPESQGEEQARGGRLADYPGAPIANTDQDRLYQSCRYDMKGYDLKVPDGVYRVTLKFCEPHFDSAGKRVCHLKLQGRTVRENFDIFAEVGKFAALDQTFDQVRVTGGMLRIDFVPVISLPCVSGIVIEGEQYGRKINCGGSAWNDYAADFAAPESATAQQRLRKVPCEDFYHDWAAALFGPEAAGQIAAVFAQIDSRLPRPLSSGCPAGLKPDRRPWQQVAADYAFVDQLEQCRARVEGPGNRERFDYWLGTMQYLRAGARLDCAVGRFQAVMEKVGAEQDPAARKRLAEQLALPAWQEIRTACSEAFGKVVAPGDPHRSTLWYRMATSGPGRMPHIGPELVDDTGVALIDDWIASLPADATARREIARLVALDEPTVAEQESRNAPRERWQIGRQLAGRNGRQRPTDADLAEAETTRLLKLKARAADRSRERTELLDQLFTATGTASTLADAVAADTLPPATRSLVLTRVAAVEPVIAGLFERFLPPAQRVQRLGGQIDPGTILNLTGDAERGRQLFATSSLMQCRSCHAVAGQGGGVGPALDRVGSRLSRGQLLESLLEPSKTVAAEYRTWLAVTDDGRAVTGLIAERTGDTVAVVDASGKRTDLPAESIEDLEALPTSLMPEQLLRDLTARQAADLLAYLQSLR